MDAVRILGDGDETVLENFLRMHADSSMFLRSNVWRAGVSYRGRPFEGIYAAAFRGGSVVGVCAHVWNGMVLVQAPVGLKEVVRRALVESRREVAGLSGPLSHVVAARRELGIEHCTARIAESEDLMALNLDSLVVPGDLQRGVLRCRHPLLAETDLLTQWRVDYSVEALGATVTPQLRASALEDFRTWCKNGDAWVLVEGNTPVAHAIFNASLPDMVQIGGVWTPVMLRGKGYGRAVVAGSLLHARAAGVRRAVLFVQRSNVAARNAYSALGFSTVGEYGLVLLSQPAMPSRLLWSC